MTTLPLVVILTNWAVKNYIFRYLKAPKIREMNHNLQREILLSQAT